MNISIELRDEQAAILASRARSLGVSAEQYAQQLIEAELRAENSAASLAGAPVPVWKLVEERTKNLPDSAFESLPQDGASEHDHYLYGSPKKGRER
jgi:hypothetical protein